MFLISKIIQHTKLLYPTPPKTGALPACSENGVLGVLPGIIGNFQALETIGAITGIGENYLGKYFFMMPLNKN